MNRKLVFTISVVVAIAIVSGMYRITTSRAGNGPAVVESIPQAPPPPVPSVKVKDVPDEIERATISAPVLKPVSEPDPPGLVISGAVVTDEDKPAAGAVVAAYAADTGATRGAAGEDGRFRVSGLRPGRYRVSASLEHFNEAVQEDVAAGTSTVRLVLQPLSAVEGKVLRGEDKQPVSQFDVIYLRVAPGNASHWQNTIRGDTAKWIPVKDGEGRYRIEDIVSDAAFAVGARAEGFEPAYVKIAALKPGATGQAPYIELLPEARVEGRVSAGGQPVAGADVFLGTEPRGRQVAKSNSDGSFTLDQLSPGLITLSASHRDYLPGSAQATLTRGQDTRIEIVLGRGGFIEGTVMDGTRQMPGQKISASRVLPPRIRKEAVTDDAGTYRIEGLPPGEVEVIAKLTRMIEQNSIPVRLQRQAVIEDGRATVVDFQLADASSAIEGTVTVGGEPAQMVKINGYVAGDSGDSFFNTTARADGTYSIQNLPPGDAWLEVTVTMKDGHERRKNIPVTIPARQTVRQDIQIEGSGSVYGKVSSIAAGEGGEVLALTGSINFSGDGIDIDELERLRVATCPISGDGSYNLKGLEAGSYTIIVIVFDPDEADKTGQMPTIRSASQTIRISGGESLEVDLVVY